MCTRDGQSIYDSKLQQKELPFLNFCIGIALFSMKRSENDI